MPVLPSGLSLLLTDEGVVRVDENWFRAAEGHFFFHTPDNEMCPPPYGTESEYFGMYVAAPVPTTLDEVKRYVRVILEPPGGEPYWRGETLADFPTYGSLSDDDKAAWESWLSEEKVIRYLDKVWDTIRTQAENCRKTNGYVLFKKPPGYTPAEPGDWEVMERRLPHDGPSQGPTELLWQVPGTPPAKRRRN